MNLIERDALKSLIDGRDPIVLLEALPERNFRAGHLPGAQLGGLGRADRAQDDLAQRKARSGAEPPRWTAMSSSKR